jgi:GntR family transcriptional regulator
MQAVHGISGVQRPDHRERRVDGARRLRDLLRPGIVDGTTDGLLNEADLQDAFGISRNTVRDALGLLRSEGLIERVPGIGTFAVARKARHAFYRVQGLSEGIERGQSRVVHELLTLKSLTAPSTVASALGLPPGSPTVLIERRSYIDGDPIAVGSHWLPASAGVTLEPADLRGELFAVFENVFGLRVKRSRLVIEAVPADAAVAELLSMPEGGALLCFEYDVMLDDGRKIALGFTRCRGDRLLLEATLPRDRASCPLETEL